MLKFTEDHEWLRIEGDTAVVGITDFAQNQLGDLVFVELPRVGAQFKKGDAAAVPGTPPIRIAAAWFRSKSCRSSTR